MVRFFNPVISLFIYMLLVFFFFQLKNNLSLFRIFLNMFKHRAVLSTNIFNSLPFFSFKCCSWNHLWRTFIISLFLLLNNSYFSARTVKPQILLAKHYTRTGLRKNSSWIFPWIFLEVQMSKNFFQAFTEADLIDARRDFLTKVEMESSFPLEKLQQHFDHTTQVIATWPILTVGRR